jgi:hypothetical protein
MKSVKDIRFDENNSIEQIRDEALWKYEENVRPTNF